jgi:hypothetical protein
MPSMKRVLGLVSVLRSDEQLGATDRRVHSARIVSPNHGVDPGFVQNALGYLSIRSGPECREDDQI